MRLRTPLLLLVGALTGAIVPSTAFAAVPTTEAKQTFPCPVGQEGAVRVWAKTSKGRVTKLAVDNPCAWYVGFSAGGTAMVVAPGTHFNWGKGRIAKAQRAGLPVVPGGVAWYTDYITCSGGDVISLVSRYNDVRFAC